MIEVSAGVVYDREGRILICKRGEGRKNAHLWEFPGGKLEPGESPERCLARELMEELSLPMQAGRILCTRTADGILFHFIEAKTTAVPLPSEHEDVRFVTPRELTAYDFCPADTPVAHKLAFAGVRHVFWDFDGTLLDSYPGMVQAFLAGAAELGIAVRPERVLSLMKHCLTHCCEVVGTENGIPAEQLINAFARHEAAVLTQGLPPMDGVREALETLHAAGVRHYVVTHRDLACRTLLDKAGLLRFFTGFVTRENGLPRKPAPDMLLHLMAQHGLTPEVCVMIGDRPLDTEAGMAAGMRSVLIDPEDRFPEGRCDLRIRSAGALAALLGQNRAI